MALLLLLRRTVAGSPLPTVMAENDVGHVHAHSILKARYDARGNAPLSDYTAASTAAEHRAIHFWLHTEHNALGAATVLPVTNSSTGHLAHHAALHAAHNARGA